RTLGHVAHVAQIAVLDHLPIRRLRHFVHFAARGRIHGIEQSRERVAEAEAAAATVADVEDSFQLGVERDAVGETWRAPVDRVARGSFQATLATRDGCVSHAEDAARARRPGNAPQCIARDYLPSVSRAFWKRFAC